MSILVINKIPFFGKYIKKRYIYHLVHYSFQQFIYILLLDYLNPGTADTVLPSGSIQSTWGVGEPWAEQLTCEPVVLENSKVDGGSWRNTGPCKPDIPRNAPTEKE